MANAFHTIHLTKFALFLIVLILVLLFISMRRKTSEPVYFEQNGLVVHNEVNSARILILDEHCILSLNAKQQCKLPLNVAINTVSTFKISNEHLKVEWKFEDNAKLDYLLFKNVANMTNTIAIKKLATEKVILDLDGAQHNVEYPSDLAKFRQQWSNGRFIECQIVLQRNESEIQRFTPLTMIDRGAEFVSHMERFNVTGFLFGGTLLGWRRECSLIPHTGDLDFAIHAREHSIPLLEDILHSQKFLLKWMLGDPREGFELTLWMDNFKTDLFYVFYNETRKQSYMTGMRVEGRQRLFWYYPRIEQLCTGAMGGHLFYVPCNVDDILAAEYGAEGWKKDFPTSQFSYDKSHKNKESGEIFTEEQWKAQYNLYYPKEEYNQTLPKWN